MGSVMAVGGGRYYTPPKTETQRIWDKWITIFGIKIPVGYHKEKRTTPGSLRVPPSDIVWRTPLPSVRTERPFILGPDGEKINIPLPPIPTKRARAIPPRG